MLYRRLRAPFWARIRSLPSSHHIGVSWTIHVKKYVDSGQWYLVPLLGIDHDFRLNAAQKEVCNKAEFPALVVELYQDQLVSVLLYKKDHYEWDNEHGDGHDSELDASPQPEEPNYYDSDENYFNV